LGLRITPTISGSILHLFFLQGNKSKSERKAVRRRIAGLQIEGAVSSGDSQRFTRRREREKHMQRRRALFKGFLATLGIAGLASAAGAGQRSRVYAIPNAEVFNQHGQKFRFYDDLIKNKVVMVNAFFAECGEACPLATENLKRVHAMFGGRVGRDVHMISISLKPDRDSPELLKQYAEVHGIGPGWQFVTGKPADMLAIRKALGFSDPDPAYDADADNHTGILRYGNDALQRWGGCPSLGRPEGIYYSVTSSVMDSGIGKPAAPMAAETAPEGHDHHQHKHSKI
jgi:protein SCO1/2